MRQPPSAVALIVYLAGALVLLGHPLLHPADHACLCLPGTTDAGVYVWAMDWWPHAIAHGLNPFHSGIVFAPRGANLAQATLVPGAALLLAPVTAAAGPLFAFNTAMFVSPVLAAFFTFLLCRRITRDFWASLVGGWTFGFSTYMLGQLGGHLNLVLVFLIPAIIHLALRALAGELGRRRFWVLMTGALALQFLFSVEIFASFTMFAAIASGLAWALGGEQLRAALRHLLPPVGLAYLAALLLVSPYLVYLLEPGGPTVMPWRNGKFSNDLLGFVIPTGITRVGGRHFLTTTNHFTAGFVEGGAYLGIPLLAMGALGARATWRRTETRVLSAVGVLALVLSLGAHLHVRGAVSLPLPWAAANHLPVTGQMLPARFVLFASLAAALLGSLWLVRARVRLVAWGMALLSVAALWPAVGLHFWQSHLGVPHFFVGSAWRHELKPRDTVLVVPVGIAGQSMLYQAETRLGFRMAGGYLGPASNPYDKSPIYPTLTYGTRVPDQQRAAARFLSANRITVAAMDANVAATSPWPGILTQLGWDSRTVDGVVLMRPAGRVPPAVLAPPPIRPVAAGAPEDQRAARVTATAYLRAFVSGNAYVFCAALTPRERDFEVQRRNAAPDECLVTVARLLDAARPLRRAARAARAGVATIGGDSGYVSVVQPALPTGYLPVRRVAGTWLVDGRLQVTGRGTP